jgi:excisionase family DNA binding protein
MKKRMNLDDNALNPPESPPTSSHSVFENSIDESSQTRWLSSEEAADYLRIPVGTLRNMTSNGRVPHYKLGRLNRYLEADLKKLLLSQKRGA